MASSFLKLGHATSGLGTPVGELGFGEIYSSDCTRRAALDKQLGESSVTATYIDPVQIR